MIMILNVVGRETRETIVSYDTEGNEGSQLRSKEHDECSSPLIFIDWGTKE